MSAAVPAGTGEPSAEVSAGNLRLALLLLEGYLYLALVVALFFAAIALLAWGFATRRVAIALPGLFVGVPILTAAAVTLRALFFRIDVPQGLPVGRDEAPALHEVTDELRRRIRAPRVHGILIVHHVNATALQVPRLAVFWPRNVLIIGFPLLAALPAGQLRAVIAHELGHFSHAHGRFSVRVYRTRLAWMRLMYGLHERGAAPLFLYALFRQYVPRLQSRSAAIARDQERIADQCAAQVAGARATADALVHGELVMRFLADTYWPAVRKRAIRTPFASMEGTIRQATLAQHEDLDGLLNEPQRPDPTHPGLAERLRRLGEAPRVPERGDRSAGEEWLGASWPRLAERMDREWLQASGEEWRADGEALQRKRDRLAELDAIAAPSAEQLMERATLIAELEGDDAALHAYRAAHDAGSAGAAFAIGTILLDRDDDEGVAFIEEAVAADEALLPEASEVLIPFLEDCDRLVEAHRWRTRATRYATLTSLAAAERAALSALDRFLPHDVGDADVANLVASLAREPRIAGAFLATRHLRYSAGEELVLAVLPVRSGDAAACAAAAQGVLARELKVIVLDAKQRDVVAILDSLPGARVHDLQSRSAAARER